MDPRIRTIALMKQVIMMPQASPIVKNLARLRILELEIEICSRRAQ